MVASDNDAGQTHGQYSRELLRIIDVGGSDAVSAPFFELRKCFILHVFLPYRLVPLQPSLQFTPLVLFEYCLTIDRMVSHAIWLMSILVGAMSRQTNVAN